MVGKGLGTIGIWVGGAILASVFSLAQLMSASGAIGLTAVLSGLTIGLWYTKTN